VSTSQVDTQYASARVHLVCRERGSVDRERAHCILYTSPPTPCALLHSTHTHTHTHPHTHKLLYPYTNALAVNTVYGVSVAYCAGRVGCPGTHRSLSRSLACLLACMLARTHARVHIRMLSLYLALPLSQGVNQHHGRWIARYSEAGQNINLGSFSTQEEAAEAWDAKARECGMRERERERERETLCVCPPVSLPACVQMSDVRNMYVIHICYICVHHECLLHSKKIRPFPLLRPAHNTHTIQGARHSTSRMLLAVTAPLSNPRPRQSRAQARPKNTRPSPWLCSLPLPPSLQCWYLCKCVF
jgi:hypothetical protein